MKQALDDTQQALRDLAFDVFGRFGDPARLAAVESSPTGRDDALWGELARTGLIGAPVAEATGGLGLGLVEAALVLEGVSAGIAIVPLVETMCAAWLLDRHGTQAQRAQWLPRICAGEVTIAVPPPGAVTDVQIAVTDGVSRLHGRLVGVPWADSADLVLVPTPTGACLIDPGAPEVTMAPGLSTARVHAPDLVLGGVTADPVGATGTLEALTVAAELSSGWRTLQAALQAGITDGAVRGAAAYTSTRQQFGKPLSTFQAVALRAADAAIDARAIQATARQAAWTLDTGGPHRAAALVAAWWAAEAGQRCVHATQHLHGGIGADITYPAHRFFLWGKQIELLLGGASALLAELGDAVVPAG
jgi:acyl-CoA dehydrogenase